MASKRGKRPGLRARSKNARTAKKEKVYKLPKRLRESMKDTLQGINEYVARPVMCFYSVDEGTPAEGKLVLVRLKNGVYRYGMVLAGRFAAHDYHTDEFVSFAHAEWITHWMEIIPPVPAPALPAQAESADEEEEAAETEFQAAGEAPERSEGVRA